MGQLVRQAPSPRDLRRPFGHCLPVAPFCEVKNQGSHPDRWPPPSLDSAPRGASRPFLGHSAKMPRIRFYNRRFASRAPATKHHLRRLPAERRGKPADVRLRDRPRRRDVSAVSSEDCAGPPCGHPASNSRVLDGTPPASGRPTAHLRARALRSDERAPRPFQPHATPPVSNPLTPLMSDRNADG